MLRPLWQAAEVEAAAAVWEVVAAAAGGQPRWQAADPDPAGASEAAPPSEPLMGNSERTRATAKPEQTDPPD